MTLGRLASAERYKGFDEVLGILPRLAKTIPNLAYLIAGDGPDRPRLEAKARSLGLRVANGNWKMADGSWKTADGSSPPSDLRPPPSLSSGPVVPSPSPPRAGRGQGEVSNPSPLSHLPSSNLSPLVIFAGRISDQEKADHSRLADAYVTPAREKVSASSSSKRWPAG